MIGTNIIRFWSIKWNGINRHIRLLLDTVITEHSISIILTHHSKHKVLSFHILNFTILQIYFIRITLRSLFYTLKYDQLHILDPIFPLTMVANLMKPLLVLFVFLVVMENSERQFTSAISVPNVEVGTPSISGLQEVEDSRQWQGCKAKGSGCWAYDDCCSRRCIFFCY